MSQQLEAAIRKIAAMPYYKNDQVQSGNYASNHEEAIASRLADHGFLSFGRPVLKSGFNVYIMKEWLEDNNPTSILETTKDMLPGSFIIQPGNKHCFPDILLKDFDNRLIAIEGKSAKDKPMWNDSLPRDQAIYVVSSSKRNKSTVFLGKDVIDPALRRELIKFHNKIKEETKNHNLDLEQIYGKTWSLYHRPQYNYHLDLWSNTGLKAAREQAVFDFCKTTI